MGSPGRTVLPVAGAGGDLGCEHGLRLDVPEAGYRRVSKGRTTKMCDFAVLAVAAATAPLRAVELKSGAAYADEAIEQLSEGLRVRCGGSLQLP